MAFALFDRDKKQIDAAATKLYGSLVAQARSPVFYGPLQVPDTVDGRYDMIVVHAALILRRIARQEEQDAAKVDRDSRSAKLAQALFDLMFADMDRNLREMGVGDLSVGKHVKKMMKAFYGRADAYERGLRAKDPILLADALAENLYRTLPDGGEAVPEAVRRTLAIHLIAQAEALESQVDADLEAGSVTFLPAESAVSEGQK
ncbi:MAG: ubiquinol-cytochrome C chaperone family protein [Rhodospirillaceae bacterium]